MEDILNELIKCLSDSSTQRVRKLLESEELGDRTPSQFLRQLRNLAGNNVPDDFIKTLWMNRLPASCLPACMCVLAVSLSLPLTEIAGIADRWLMFPKKSEAITLKQTSANDANREIAIRRNELQQL
ncbi:hypothetical protein NQ315_003602 [Exocentrus adspersus]|uniref:Uncharacterized protein n=1 Tax=Exocentrus adspersus TaxID=1586481 RepID=A0AAV8VIR6_9CUCU|nr:hypothetical protein NQ315_003602 [Exocentrus adspersus]